MHKTNVLTFAGDLWQRTFDEVAAEYPDVATAYNHVDAACIYFVQDPGRYDVIVTDNLFGDILTDLGGAVSGGIGLAASANLNPARTGPSHVRAGARLGARHRRHRQGQPRSPPSSRPRMMLDFLGEADAAARIRKAVRHVRRCRRHDHRDRRRDRRRLLTRAQTKGPRCPSRPPRRSG